MDQMCPFKYVTCFVFYSCKKMGKNIGRQTVVWFPSRGDELLILFKKKKKLNMKSKNLNI